MLRNATKWRKCTQYQNCLLSWFPQSVPPPIVVVLLATLFNAGYRFSINIKIFFGLDNRKVKNYTMIALTDIWKHDVSSAIQVEALYLHRLDVIPSAELNFPPYFVLHLDLLLHPLWLFVLAVTLQTDLF